MAAALGARAEGGSWGLGWRVSGPLRPDRVFGQATSPATFGAHGSTVAPRPACRRSPPLAAERRPGR